jgi:ADP-dependent NAD(P)H-hydrate dehydratase / NAD(P)H-hydrate epimerase
MLPVLTPAEMTAADRAAIAAGTSEATLVERAGRALALLARQMLGGSYGRRVVVLAGPGNNGADGKIAAAVLRRWGVRVAVIDVPLVVDRSVAERALSRATLVIDAMYGTGLRRPLADDAAWLVAQLEHRRVLAADIPSGVDGATGLIGSVAARAERTCCFQALKVGLLFEPGRSQAGEVGVVDLGIPVMTSTYAVTTADVVVTKRAPDAHKWSRSVLVVGGSGGMIGAPLLAARAALRSGAGMVVVGLAGVAARRASAAEIVTREYPSDPDGSFAGEAASRIVRDAARFGSVVVGPGLGRSIGADSVAARAIAEVATQLVVDADAINVLAADPAPLRVRHAAGLPMPVFTPHSREYERLVGRRPDDDRIEAARSLAARLGGVVLLKGPGTVVAHPNGQARVVRAGGTELATAGTGDVLAGVIAARLAAGDDAFTAAWSAAAVHAEAGRRSVAGDGTVASDVVEALPVAWAGAGTTSTIRS